MKNFFQLIILINVENKETAKKRDVNLLKTL